MEPSDLFRLVSHIWKGRTTWTTYLFMMTKDSAFSLTHDEADSATTIGRNNTAHGYNLLAVSNFRQTHTSRGNHRTARQ